MSNTTLTTMFVIALLATAGQALAADQEPTLVGRVGSHEITAEDVEREVNRLIPGSFFHARVSAEIRRKLVVKAFENLVERTLIHLDAQERGLEASEQEIRDGFEVALEQAGPEYASVDEAGREQLLQGYRPLIERRVLIDENEARFEASLPPVADEQIAARYDERRGELLSPLEARFQHIFVRVDPASSGEQAAELYGQMEDIVARLGQGTPFETLARQFSNDIYAEQGGDMGFVTRGSFRDKELDEAAFALADGETSGILSTLRGFHLVRRLESRPQRTLSLEETWDALAAELEEEQAATARAQWLAGLAEHHGVERLVDPASLVPPDAADGGEGRAPHHDFGY